MHMVDYVAPLLPFAPKKLKSEVFNNIHTILLLCRPQQMADRFIKATRLNAGFLTLWLTVSLLLALLFWFLSIQQLPEKNIIRLWAIVETLLVIMTLCGFSNLVAISFTFLYVTYAISMLAQWLILSLCMMAFLRIFGYGIPNKWLRVSVVASLGLGILDIYFDSKAVLFSAGCICLQLVFIYVIIISWKRLKGAQWAIVVGLGFSVLFAAFVSVVTLTKTNSIVFSNVLVAYILQSGLLLSLPLSFLVYLVLRFKETLAEVQINAAAVVLVTEEKRALLADQNERLEQQVEARTTELKASQAQLIQKEKLASLGELTAGIAHEIQNPLNFVNNFSEVSTELIDELEDELDKGDTDEAKAIAGDIRQNLQKIHHHGGRASSIVKGMLEHSRTESGEKRPTDLNALADEYLKIAYHGLRAKNQSFNCELVTNFDPTPEPVNVAPQEIGRVLLNLYNNAFYAVHEQGARCKGQGMTYQPRIDVSTQRSELGVEIRVKDNGTGIPESVKAKIFQPFFTTKPTGEGTGLGLSLSYDIITKGHNGTLTVMSKKGEGTEFVITLPV
ncbi:hypothetical protein GO755_38125 [Spirosoma sp. HMF4905]|uniref:histidine kinase n=2 Tax=Spirosoma arboris TaxID=2682092 RepID=A0A7K1SPZ9_9BACT|nr:hypothetical protein [Spirosoma arboris]